MIRYPINYVPRCGVRCSRCGRPQYDTMVYQTGEYIFCKNCLQEWLKEIQ